MKLFVAICQMGKEGLGPVLLCLLPLLLGQTGFRLLWHPQELVVQQNVGCFDLPLKSDFYKWKAFSICMI